MKKIISIILALCLLFSLTALIACDSTDGTDNSDNGENKNTENASTTASTTDSTNGDSSNENENAGNNESGNENGGNSDTTDENKSSRLLPEKFTLSGITASDLVIPLNWTENGCTFTIEGTTYAFEYDKAARSLDLKGTSSNGVFSDSKGFCKFDEQGRVISVTYDSETVMAFSYENGKMSVTACISSGASFPISLNPNFDNNTVIAPPFESAASVAHFNEHGDLTGVTDDEYYELFSYEYDDNENITKISLASASITYTYGDDAMDGVWQQYVLKFLNTSMRASLSVFVTDVMCENLPR